MADSTTAVVRTQPSRLALFYRHVFVPVLLGLVIATFLDYASGGAVRPWYVWVFLLAVPVLMSFDWHRAELSGESLTLKALFRTRRVDLSEATAVSMFTLHSIYLVNPRLLWIRRPGPRWRQVVLILNNYANHRQLEDAIIRAAQRANPEIEFLYDAAARAHALRDQG